ncbi:Translation factor pelota, partial [Ascosphaera pollenicola]
MPLRANLHKMVPNSPRATFKLKSGYEIPVLGFGVYKTPPDVTKDCVAAALKAGYRHVDCAQVYQNEKQVGEAIRESGINREEIFYTTKISRKKMGYDNAKKSIEDSIKAAGLGYIDLILIHAPYGGRESREGTWRALVEAQKSGLVRSIGVSNYGVDHLNEWEEYKKRLGGDIDVGQYELHP